MHGEEAPAAPRQTDDEFERELRELYRGTAPEKLATIAASLAGVHAAPRSAGAAETLRRTLHTIAGSAGTYGFMELGSAALRVEQRILDGARALPLSGEVLHEVARFAQQLEATLRPVAEPAQSF